MKMKTKLFAFLAVALMMALPLAAFVPSADADTDSNDSIDRIDDMSLEELSDLNDGEAPMLLGDSRATGVLEGMYPGSWTWDRTTGIGPFNSFYAAFDVDDGNRFVAVLDPYDLSKEISGDPLDDTKNYNIMWVVPTLYWSVEDGNVTITNDSTSGGTAYAHTIDGHVYNYIAIGVYHGDYRTLANGPTVLTSESGVVPEANHNRPDFRDKANNYTMDSSLNTSADAPAHSMLWNFYQWTMYKLIAYTVMEDFDSQAVVGNGNVNGGNYTLVTGGCDLLGPYAGNNGDLRSSGSNAATFGQDYAKLFIEEPWGTVYDFVDGVVINNAEGYYLDSSSVPTDSKTVGGNVTLISATIPSNNFGTAISTDPAIWGCATATNSSSSYYNKGTCDKFGASTGDKSLFVGGISNSYATDSLYYGLSYGAMLSLSYSGTTTGARLAFVFDAGPASNGGAAYSYTIDYDPTLMSTTSKAISVDSMDPITHDFPTYTISVASDNVEYGTIDVSELTDIQWGTTVTVDGNTLTIGETVITATPAEGYRLASWSVANGDVITSDTTITATFELIPVPEPVENKLVKLIPLIVIIALTVIAAMALMSFTGNGIDLIKLLIGLTVCVLFVAMAMIPAVGGFRWT